MAQRINNENFAEEITFELNDLAGLMSIFANDLLFLHHHAVGEKFDTIHSITESLYKKAIEHIDTLSEQAIIWKEKVGNFNVPEESLKEIYGEPCQEEKIDWLMMINVLDDKGNIIIEALHNLADKYTSDVKSLIDEIILYWNKEINYKNAARLS